MSRFLNTLGQPTLGIGICDRHKGKVPLGDLMPDPNSPGTMVCADCIDEYDPWRLPPRETEDITLPFYRPDLNIDQAGVKVKPQLTVIAGNVFWNIDGQPMGGVDLGPSPIPFSPSLDFEFEENGQYVSLI